MPTTTTTTPQNTPAPHSVPSSQQRKEALLSGALHERLLHPPQLWCSHSFLLHAAMGSLSWPRPLLGAVWIFSSSPFWSGDSFFFNSLSSDFLVYHTFGDVSDIFTTSGLTPPPYQDTIYSHLLIFRFDSERAHSLSASCIHLSGSFHVDHVDTHLHTVVLRSAVAGVVQRGKGGKRAADAACAVSAVPSVSVPWSSRTLRKRNPS